MKNKDIIIVNTFPNSEKKRDLTIKYLSQLKKTGKDILLISHLPLDADIISMVNYFIYDYDNFLLPVEKCPVIWFADNRETIHLYSHNHCYAIVKNMYLSINFVKSLGYKNFVFTEYDVDMNDDGIEKIKSVFDILDIKKGFVFQYDTTKDFVMYTNFFAFNTDFFISSIQLIKSVEEWYTTYPYSSIIETIEILFTDMLKPYMKEIHVETQKINEYFCSTNFNVHSVYENGIPIVYNIDNHLRPLVFQITNTAHYQIYIDNRLIYDYYHTQGEWLKKYIDLGDNPIKLQILVNGNLRFEDFIDTESVNGYKNNGLVKKII